MCKGRLPVRSAYRMTFYQKSIAAVTLLLLVGCASDSRREEMLQDQLVTLRFEIQQYTMDRQKRPQSLRDLADAGYIKQVPLDPFTGRNDTWVPELSADAQNPGIANVRSGTSAKDKHGLAYSSW
jgi:general secretion pathway protein G